MQELETNLSKLQQFVEKVDEGKLPERYTSIIKVYKSFINAQLSLAVSFAEKLITILGKQEPQTKQYDTPTIEYDKAWFIKFKFGKHNGETLKKVFDTDIEWLYWISRQDNITGVIKGAMNAVQEDIVNKYDNRKDFVGSQENEADDTFYYDWSEEVPF